MGKQLRKHILVWTKLGMTNRRLLRLSTLLFLLAPIFLPAQSVSPNAKWQPLTSQVNSSYTECTPVITADGQTIYFSRKKHPQNIGSENKEDIWISKKMAGGSWSRPINAGFPLNNQETNYVIAINPEADTIFLGGKYRYGSNAGIFFSRRDGRIWSRPVFMPIKDFAPQSTTLHFSVSVNGKYLLIASQEANTLGGSDLYVSFRKPGNTWSTPLNLGPVVNKQGQEASVFLAADGKTIYFSSDRPGGFGGLDLYMSKRLDKTWTRWSEPQNMGPSINTEKDDLHYSVPASGKTAYAYYPGLNEQTDLFRIDLPESLQPEPVILVRGQFLDRNTSKRIPARLAVEELRKNGAAVQYDADKNGQFQVIVPYDAEIGFHAISVSEGYVSLSAVIDPDSSLEEEDLGPYGGLIAQTSSDPETVAIQQRLSQVDEELTELSKAADIRTDATPRSVDRSGKTNPDVEKLRERYQAYLEPEKGSRPKGKLTAKGISDTKSEVERMKEKYRQLNADDTAPDPEVARPNEDADLVQMKETYQKLHTEKTEQQAVVPKFEKIEEEVRSALTERMKPAVKQELRKELFPGVSAELMDDLRQEELELLPQVQRKLIPKYLGKSSQEEMDWENIDWNAADLPQWLTQLREELKASLRAEIQQELRAGLTAQIKEELRRELLYEVKLELEAELREELAARVSSPSSPATVDVDENPVYREVNCDILLIPVREGEVIPLHNVFFKANESVLKGVSFRELDRMLQFLHNEPDLIIEVGGHTNGWCTHSFANELSKERAILVREYFVKNGISPNRITAKGYGKTQPIASNDTTEGRKKNQRVELKIVRILDF